MDGNIDSDGLRQLRNFFYLGMFDNALAEVANVKKLHPSLAAIADTFHYRSLLGLKRYDDVFAGIGKNAPLALQAVKLQGTYQTADVDNRDMVFETLTEWLGDDTLCHDEVLRIVAAHIYMAENDFKSALALVHNGHNFECMALCVQIYLALDRRELADKTLRAMQDLDDNDTLTQLASTWVCTVAGGERVTEAYFLLQELVDKFGPSVTVLNALAVCQIALRNYSDAFQHLRQARELALNSGGAGGDNKKLVSEVTLVNTLVCLQHLQKSADVVARIRDELAAGYPDSAWLKQQTEVTAMFDRCAANYAL